MTKKRTLSISHEDLPSHLVVDYPQYYNNTKSINNRVICCNTDHAGIRIQIGAASGGFKIEALLVDESSGDMGIKIDLINSDISTNGLIALRKEIYKHLTKHNIPLLPPDTAEINLTPSDKARVWHQISQQQTDIGSLRAQSEIVVICSFCGIVGQRNGKWSEEWLMHDCLVIQDPPSIPLRRWRTVEDNCDEENDDECSIFKASKLTPKPQPNSETHQPVDLLDPGRLDESPPDRYSEDGDDEDTVVKLTSNDIFGSVQADLLEDTNLTTAQLEQILNEELDLEDKGFEEEEQKENDSDDSDDDSEDDEDNDDEDDLNDDEMKEINKLADAFPELKTIPSEKEEDKKWKPSRIRSNVKSRFMRRREKERNERQKKKEDN